MLLSASLLTAACSGSDDGVEEESFSSSDEGVFVLCEGNFNAGNATLSYYDPVTKKVEKMPAPKMTPRIFQAPPQWRCWPRPFCM